MSSSYQPLLFTILVFFLGSIFLEISPALGGKTHVDSWAPVKNLSETKMVEIGKFAVEKHNNEANAKLVFQKLVKGKVLQGYGTEYNLTITAKDSAHNDIAKNYLVVVVDAQFMNKLRLVSFKGPV